MPRLRRSSPEIFTDHVISLKNVSRYDGEPLYSAIIEDDLEKLEYSLGQPNVDLNSRNYVTALYLSLQLLRSDSFIIRLIEAGCDPNLTTTHKDAPLHIAVNRLTTKVARKLIEKGADVNALDSYNRTPLHYAVLNNNLEAVCMLLYHGASVNLEDVNFETPIVLGLRYESWEIISALMGYYDSSEHISWLIKSTKPFRHNSVKLKMLLYLVQIGANVNYIDGRGNNPLLFSLRDTNDELFKLIWSRLDHAILLECPTPFLTNYINHCKFLPSQWLKGLHLILESPIARDLIKSATKLGAVFYNLLNACGRRKIESKDALAVIYLFLSLETHVHSSCFKIVHRLYEFHEELEALIYCTSTNVNNYKPRDCSLNFPLIINPLKEEPSTEEVFQWLKYEIEVSDADDREHLMKGIVNTLGFFWLPPYFITKLFNLFEKQCEFWGDIAELLNEVDEVPSLCEISRNKTRKYIRKSFKIKRTYEFYDILKKLYLPQVIYDIICFKKPVY